MTADDPQQAAPDEAGASPRLPMLAVVDQLTAIAGDVRADAKVAGADGDRERREYLMGENRGLMEAAEAMLAFDWTAAWREACAIRTVEQLDALPEGSVVRDAEGDVAVKGFAMWFLPGVDDGFAEIDLALPALLLWNPEWDRSRATCPCGQTLRVWGSCGWCEE